MTTDTPDRDPDLQHAIDTAARELARRIRPWTADSTDVDGIARRYLEDLYRDGNWRPIPRPQPIPGQGGPRNPDTARRGAAAARQALRGAQHDEETP